MRLPSPDPDVGRGQFCKHGKWNRGKQATAERGVSERGAAVGAEYLSAGWTEHNLDGIDVDAGPRGDGDTRAGAGEDCAGGVHDERGGAADGWNDAGECDDCGGGE